MQVTRRIQHVGKKPLWAVLWACVTHGCFSRTRVCYILPPPGLARVLLLQPVHGAPYDVCIYVPAEPTRLRRP